MRPKSSRSQGGLRAVHPLLIREDVCGKPWFWGELVHSQYTPCLCFMDVGSEFSKTNE